jgi:hypothetical protein
MASLLAAFVSGVIPLARYRYWILETAARLGRRWSHDPRCGRPHLPLLLTSFPAAAMVGGAQPTSDGAGRAVVMLTGSHGTFCSGVALTPDLVLRPHIACCRAPTTS